MIFMTTVVCVLHRVVGYIGTDVSGKGVSRLHSVMSQTNEILIFPIATGLRKGLHPRIH
jgi:hypothetical protein